MIVVKTEIIIQMHAVSDSGSDSLGSESTVGAVNKLVYIINVIIIVCK